MQGNSEGLTPTLRPQLGVGWNRALPGAFGFDNGIKPDGVNDFLTVPGMVGKTFPASFTVEFWVKIPATESITNRFIGIFGPTPTFQTLFDTSITSSNKWNLGLYNGTNQNAADAVSGLSHLVFSYNGTSCRTFLNGSLYSTIAFTSIYPQTVGTFRLFSGNNSFPSPYFKYLTDEFRFYNTAIESSEVVLNYNTGIGSNPNRTEFIQIWYKFEKFETLDFSALQDGSDMRTGIRDLSNRNNHAQPFNMDTNPASGTYIIKPF